MSLDSKDSNTIHSHCVYQGAFYFYKKSFLGFLKRFLVLLRGFLSFFKRYDQQWSVNQQQ